MMNLDKFLSEEVVEIVSKEILTLLRKEDRETLGHRFWMEMIQAISPFEKRFTITLKKYFKSQERVVLANMKKAPKYWRTKDIFDFWLFGKQEWDERLSEEGALFLAELIESEGIRVIQQLQHLTDDEILSIGFDVTNPNVQTYIETHSYKFSSFVNETTTNQLRTTLAAGMALGETMEELRDRVSSVYTAADRYRSMMIARSETIRASNAAANMSYEQSGVVEAKEWHTSLGDRVCPYCAKMHGVIIGLKENFISVGETLEP